MAKGEENIKSLFSEVVSFTRGNIFFILLITGEGERVFPSYVPVEQLTKSFCEGFVIEEYIINCSSNVFLLPLGAMCIPPSSRYSLSASAKIPPSATGAGSFPSFAPIIKSTFIS